MNDICIFKTSYNVNDCINLTDVGKEFITKTFTTACTAYKTCNIDKLHDRGSYFFGIVHFCKDIQPFVGNCNKARTGRHELAFERENKTVALAEGEAEEANEEVNE